MEEELKFSVYNNRLVYLLILFLPFSYALTLNIGFPLKISEICLVILSGIILLSNRFFISKQDTSSLLATSLFVVYLVSFALNAIWKYPYDLNTSGSRFGYQFDSFLALMYIVMAIFVFIISTYSFSKNREKYIRVFIMGAILASIYGWYLFFSSLLNLPYIKLPGMEANPQAFAIGNISFIRCGTFKEGNYFGLFLLFSVVFSVYLKRLLLALFFSFTVLITASTVSILSVILFWALYLTFGLIRQRKYVHMLLAILLLLVVFSIFSSTSYYRKIVTSKISGSISGPIRPDDVSRAQRWNFAYTAFHMGIDNFFFGVGPSNFSLHFKKYMLSSKETIKEVQRSFVHKVIPNNIFMQIFSESGFFGLFVFLLFLISIYLTSGLDDTRILRFGLIASILNLMAFPSFTMLFLWVYWGLINSFKVSKNE